MGPWQKAWAPKKKTKILGFSKHRSRFQLESLQNNSDFGVKMHPEILNWVCVCVNINRKSYGKLHFGGLGLGLDPGQEILQPESLAPKKNKKNMEFQQKLRF